MNKRPSKIIWHGRHRGMMMGKINLIIPDKLEKEFREAIFKRFGMKRGNISKAIEEAIRDWIKKQK